MSSARDRDVEGAVAALSTWANGFGPHLRDDVLERSIRTLLAELDRLRAEVRVSRVRAAKLYRLSKPYEPTS